MNVLLNFLRKNTYNPTVCLTQLAQNIKTSFYTAIYFIFCKIYDFAARILVGFVHNFISFV